MISKVTRSAKYPPEDADVAVIPPESKELRGIDLGRHMNVESVHCCDTGHVLILGWADRRYIPTFDVTIEVGDGRYAVGKVETAWYVRPDVSAVIGSSEHPAGFQLLLHLDNVALYPDFSLSINGRLVFKETNIRWLSIAQFINVALGAASIVETLPIGHSLPAARVLHSSFLDVWRAYLNKLDFALAFETAQTEPVAVSIIITLYRRADMLIPQLEALGPTLVGAGAEVIVVCNDLQGPEVTVERLRGFCQIWDFPVRLYLCSGNSGFSRANNFGAEVARGQTLIFMNPDVFPPEDDVHLPGVLSFLRDDPGKALHGAMLYYGDGALMHAGMYAVSDVVFDVARATVASISRVEHFGKGLIHNVDDSPDALEAALKGLRRDVLLVSAALWKIDRALFLELGGLSTDYIFAYYEDADFALRMLERGMPIVLDQGSRWIHLEGVGKAFSPQQRAFMWLNRYLFTERFGGSSYVVTSHDDLYLL